jgi:hypothetical protein
MIFAHKITDIVMAWCNERDDYPSDNELALLDERVGSYLDMEEILKLYKEIETLRAAHEESPATLHNK